MAVLWKQIYDQERQRLHCGNWLPGQVFATAQTVSATYGVSHITARRVLTELAKSGAVKNVPRLGCVIADKKVEFPIYFLAPEKIVGGEVVLMVPLMLKGLFEEAIRQNLKLIPITVEQLKQLSPEQPGILIYTYSLNLISSRVFVELLPKNILPCGIHCPAPPVRGLGVGADAATMMDMQVSEMLAQGRRKIGYVGLGEPLWFEERLSGFIKSMRRHNLFLELDSICPMPDKEEWDFRSWYQEFQPDGICTSGIKFAEQLIQILSPEEREKTLVGSIGIPPRNLPGYFYIQPDYYQEGCEIIKLIAQIQEDDWNYFSADSKFLMVSGILHKKGE